MKTIKYSYAKQFQLLTMAHSYVHAGSSELEEAAMEEARSGDRDAARELMTILDDLSKVRKRLKSYAEAVMPLADEEKLTPRRMT